jgi:hypothetical protein
VAGFSRAYRHGGADSGLGRRLTVCSQARRKFLKSFDAWSIDRYPLDSELTDVGQVGPELAHLAQVYLDSPRALVFRQPSSEWHAWVLLPPIATRLSLLGNPIFAQLTRAWGFNLRFVGIDQERRVFDFRSLLADDLLLQLIALLGQSQPGPSQPSSDSALTDSERQARTTDVLFASLARDTLTALDKRRSDWGKHLDTHHRLESGVRDSLFQRETRYPDFLMGLRRALRDELIDVHFYGRVLRSVDAREQAIEARLGLFLESCLDPVAMAKLGKSSSGYHLGCYNWLHLSPKHAANRAHILRELPNFAAYFAQSLVKLDTLSALADPQETDELYAPTLDLPELASRNDTVHSLRWAAVLRQAVDAGQDRLVIEALAQRFAVPDNVLRRLWRDKPLGLGALPTWQLAQVLRHLAPYADRDWPESASAWTEVLELAAE